MHSQFRPTAWSLTLLVVMAAIFFVDAAPAQPGAGRGCKPTVGSLHVSHGHRVIYRLPDGEVGQQPHLFYPFNPTAGASQVIMVAASCVDAYQNPDDSRPDPSWWVHEGLAAVGSEPRVQLNCDRGTYGAEPCWRLDRSLFRSSAAVPNCRATTGTLELLDGSILSYRLPEGVPEEEYRLVSGPLQGRSIWSVAANCAPPDAGNPQPRWWVHEGEEPAGPWEPVSYECSQRYDIAPCWWRQ